jgi:hypothetical protein
MGRVHIIEQEAEEFGRLARRSSKPGRLQGIAHIWALVVGTVSYGFTYFR